MQLPRLLLKRLNITKEGRRNASEIDQSPVSNVGAELPVADLQREYGNTGLTTGCEGTI